MAPLPITQLNSAPYKVLAVSALTGENQEQVRKLWQDRFHHQEAFWVDVQEGQDENAIARTVAQTIAQQGVFDVGHLLITTFVDLTKPMEKVPLDAISRLPDELAKAFFSIIPAPVVFGYAGQLVFASNRDQIRQNCREILENDLSLYLVGIPALQVPTYPGATGLWKATVLLLDIMRRQIDPSSVLPNGQLGYLRYGEYNETLWRELDGELQEVKKRLSNGGAQELSLELYGCLNQIRMEVPEKYVINPKYQPLHPDMEVKGLLDKHKARRGSNQKYNAARMATLNALVATGTALSQGIQEYYREKMETADQLLQQLFEKACVGLLLQKDRQTMTGLLSPAQDPLPPAPTESLSYTDNGYPEAYEKKIEEYLEKCRHNTMEKVVRDLLEKLKNAYMAIPDSELEDQIRKLTQEKNKLEAQLKPDIAPSREEFEDRLQKLVHNSLLPITTCNAMMGGGSSSHIVLCRTQDDANTLSACLAVGMKLYYLDKYYLKQVDGAPLKGIQVFAFPFTEERLNALI